MERIYGYFSFLSLLFSFYFGGLAAFSFVDEHMDKMYLNIGYCALFLSIMIFTLEMKKHKKTERNDQ
ncbi:MULTISPECIES: protein YpmT [Bacillus]|uniref:protein YpmT n=1 Tax=Bacillus TaxID=1386 RepID=UPI00098B1A1F|nr:protein YpmT [Bacillus sonorensis]